MKKKLLLGIVGALGVLLLVTGLVVSEEKRFGAFNFAVSGAGGDSVFSSVSTTVLVVSGTSTQHQIMLGQHTVVDLYQQSPLFLHYTASQAQANNYAPSISIRNASSTLSSGIEFKNAAFSGSVGSIIAYNESAPPDMGLTVANKLMIGSTSGTFFLVGEGSAAYQDGNGVFRPLAGLGFGGGFAGINSNASTTISDGNYATASLDFGNSAAAGTQDLTITVVGAAAGNECQLGVPNALASRSGEAFTCFVSAANTITVRRTCVTGVGCGDPLAATVGTGYFNRQ